MSELWQIIQGHLDEYGVREAAFARRMGTKPQTLNSWKKRGLKQLPSRDLLEAVAREVRVPYEDVLRAALTDINYLGDHHDETPTSRAGVSPADDDTYAGTVEPPPNVWGLAARGGTPEHPPSEAGEESQVPPEGDEPA